jgi:uncharacterized protein (UPF0262 family)
MSLPDNFRIIAVELDESAIIRRTREIEQERDIAIYDLLEANRFCPLRSSGGPYRLNLHLEEGKLIFEIALENGQELDRVALSLIPFRRLIKDYFVVCESYFKAIRDASRAQIEALDMGRRGLHDEASMLLRERLADRVEVDFETARRLFTLICVLQARG